MLNTPTGVHGEAYAILRTTSKVVQVERLPRLEGALGEFAMLLLTRFIRTPTEE